MSVTYETFPIVLPPKSELAKPDVPEGSLDTVRDPLTGLSLDTYTVNGRKGLSKKTALIFQPWSDYVARPFAQQRMDMIADTLDALVIGVDNLGVGDHTSNIPWQREMRRELRRGDFSKVSELQWRAIEANEAFRDTDELTLAYYSLGTTMAMSMAAHAPENVRIDRMVLWDCAAIEPPEVKDRRLIGTRFAPQRRFGKLALDFATEGGKNWNVYLSENPSWVEKPSSPLHLVRRILRQPGGHYLYPYGMAQTTAFDDMEKAHANGALSPDSIIHVINGGNSEISPTGLNDRFAEQLASLKMPTPDVVRTLLPDEYHAIQDSFRRTKRVLGRIANHTYL